MVSRIITPSAGMPAGARYGQWVGALALLALASAPWWVYQLFLDRHGLDYLYGSSDLVISAIVIPSIVGLALALLFIWSKEERWLWPTLATGVVLKIAFAAVYLYFTLDVYSGVADISHYLWGGKQLAIGYELAGKLPILKPFYNTNFVTMVTGSIMIVLGQTVAGPIVIFALCGYLGQYVFYRAFRTAYPDGDRWLAALLCLLTPSLLFWTSGVGKDALILPGVALCFFGFAKINARDDFRGFLILLSGLSLVVIVRPHVAGMIAISLVTAYLLGRNLKGKTKVIARVIGIPLVVAGTFYLVSRASMFLDLTDFSSAQHALNTVARVNRVGGSAFGSSSLWGRILYAPFLMFRPFPWEVRNPQSAAAAAEGFLLMIIFCRQRYALLKVVRTARRDPFILFALIYILEMCITLAGGMTNFGLLVRQRVMVLPPVLLLLCVPPAAAASPRQRPAWVEHLYHY